jgi:uncharacterized protein (DUF305 family)
VSVVLVAVVASIALTGCGPGGSGTAQGASGAATTPLDPAAAAAQDAAFATAMIEHHHQTLQLVGLAAAHAENPAVLDYAGDLQTLQDTQIGDLRTLMTGWGKSPPEYAGHTDLDGAIPGVLDKAQFAALVASAPAAFEKAFLTTLITQQRKALPIAQKEIASGGDPQAKGYAQRIVTDVSGQLDALAALSQS